MKLRLLRIFIGILLLISNNVFAQDKNIDLLIAADKGNEEAVIKLLLDSADINARSEEDVTPLIYAAQNGHLNIVKILVYNKANIEAYSTQKTTALMAAAINNRTDVVDYLIKEGAKIQARDLYGANSLIYSVAYGYYILTDMLIFYGANPNEKSNDSISPLMIAALNNDTAICNLLIKNGAKINDSNQYGYTALMYAVSNNCKETTKLLLDIGANMELSNNQSYTPLCLAAEKGNYEIAETLINKGAAVNIEVPNYKKPISIAQINNHTKLAHLIREKGGKSLPLPYYNKISFGLASSFNLDDFLLGGEIGINDDKLKTSFNLDFLTRIGYVRVLKEINDSISYQYWEKRNLISLNFEKRFNIRISKNQPSEKERGILIGIKGFYSYGSYSGSEKKPECMFFVSPQVGFFAKGQYTEMKIYYEYQDFKSYKISPHRINIGLKFDIPLKSETNSSTKINWL